MGNRSIFEPLVIASIDLDELTEACSSISGLVRTFGLLAPGRPDAVVHHPAANRRYRGPNVMQICELLVGQGRSKVRVALPNELERFDA